MILRGPEEIKVGDCFYNTKGENCLRVRYVGPDYVNYMTWRANGSHGSTLGQMPLESLTRKPYVRITGVFVFTEGGGKHGFGLTPEVL
jgi:hypothetical protein